MYQVCKYVAAVNCNLVFGNMNCTSVCAIDQNKILKNGTIGILHKQIFTLIL